MADRFLTLDQATGLLPVAKITLRRAIRTGELAAFKPGRSIVIKESDFYDWVDSRQVIPAERRATSLPTSGATLPGTGSLRDRALQRRAQR